MGAMPFYTPAAGRNVNRAFFNARSKAAWEHGHRDYSGTVYEKDEVTLLDEPKRPLPQAIQRAEELIEARDPRFFPRSGPAGALPIEAGTAEPSWLFFGLAAC
ncbi:hypothetical protein [Streptomyces regalis]|uniref:Uncharacterized protein n=1 Tax=Streptomyces regalis TaxID=68262 RepID=A0A101JAI0_9ACTN|nr:hypothetical protein [Streptomyces regalis]KUL23204.1 hypothetical protein ADL12_39685 [Streptomyces regalis]